MEEVFVEDKQKFLNEQPPPFGGYKLTEKVRCIHCDEVVTVGDYKIFKEKGDDFLYICCPNAPECDGTIIDWIPEKDSNGSGFVDIPSEIALGMANKLRKKGE